MLNPRVLLVEDDIDLSEVICETTSEFAQVDCVYNFTQAKNQLMQNQYDVVVTDYLLPDQNGLQVAEYVHLRSPETPVIMITVARDWALVSDLMDFGIQGFLPKPFESQQLIDKINCVVARAKSQGKAKIQIGPDCFLNLDSQGVTSLNGFVQLTSIEFEIIRLLAINSGRLVSQENLRRQIWSDSKPEEGAIYTHLCNLKKKVPEIRSRLRSVRSRGYILDCE